MLSRLVLRCFPACFINSRALAESQYSVVDSLCKPNSSISCSSQIASCNPVFAAISSASQVLSARLSCFQHLAEINCSLQNTAKPLTDFISPPSDAKFASV
ncbi:hypothetical protein PF005_g32657 [Phytophthora fragariae]|uniref:Uncharacterized protein n=1 Tax=Phytophthora fragariae TaxID=53985 RepID=A0A6A3V0P3_9STRA|nr:hypothetical protein PF005_g32657 [Phytophthora fragariae]